MLRVKVQVPTESVMADAEEFSLNLSYPGSSPTWSLKDPTKRVNHIVQAIGSSALDKGKDFVSKHLSGKEPTAYKGYDAVYKNPNVDIVYIGTHAFHKKNTLDAIRAGTLLDIGIYSLTWVLVALEGCSLKFRYYIASTIIISIPQRIHKTCIKSWYLIDKTRVCFHSLVKSLNTFRPRKQSSS